MRAALIFFAAGLAGLLPPLHTDVPSDAPPLKIDTLYVENVGILPVNILHTLVHWAFAFLAVAALLGVFSVGAYARGLAIVLTVFTVGTVARWRAVRARRRTGRATRAPQRRPEPEHLPEQEAQPTPRQLHEVPTPRGPEQETPAPEPAQLPGLRWRWWRP